MRDHVSDYRFAIVSASPTPELGERANVAIVVGNGTPTKVLTAPGVPRLAGMIATDEVGVYGRMLSGLEQLVDAGATWEEVSVRLGPQFTTGPLQPLLAPYSEDTFRVLRAAILERPIVPYRTEAETADRRAGVMLARLVDQLRPRGTVVVRRKSIEDLYQAKLSRFVNYSIPKARAVVRGEGRDIVLDSVLVEPSRSKGPVNVGVMRASRIFHAYHRLESLIERQAATKVQRVGVILPSESKPTADSIAAREWVRAVWEVDALVIDGDHEPLSEVLRDRLTWAIRG